MAKPKPSAQKDAPPPAKARLILRDGTVLRRAVDG